MEKKNEEVENKHNYCKRQDRRDQKYQKIEAYVNKRETEKKLKESKLVGKGRKVLLDQQVRSNSKERKKGEKLQKR